MRTRCLLAVALLGCASAPRAELGAKAPDPVLPTGDVERHALGPGNLRVEADVSAGSAYTLRFPTATGTFVFSPRTPEASTVDVSIDTTAAVSSLQLVADIAKDEFLHTSQHPRARFTSAAWRKNKEGGFDLYGTLSLHGTDKTLATPATIVAEPCKLVISVEFAIDRRAFGAISAGSLDPLVSDTVVVRILADVARAGLAADGKSPCPKGAAPTAVAQDPAPPPGR